jgi:regulator of PEP synthase PpsR (kinase-PPPase family)
VEHELKYCHQLYRSPPAWPVVDVTGKSIEEIANEVCAVTVDSPLRSRART